MNGKLSSRKFLLTAVTLILSFAALFAGKLQGSEVVTLVSMVLGIFTGGNVAAKHRAFVEAQ